MDLIELRAQRLKMERIRALSLAFEARACDPNLSRPPEKLLAAAERLRARSGQLASELLSSAW